MKIDDIRLATPEDLPLVAPIERAAGAMFAEAGMPEIAANPPTPRETLEDYLSNGILLLATERGVVVGFAATLISDRNAHLDQMSVHPDHARRGHGTRLLEAVCWHARERGCDHVTLTTFKHLSWNAPYYAKRGFRVLDPSELTPDLHALRAEEASFGLDPALRVVMRLDQSS